MPHEHERLVHRVVGAVAEHDPGLVEPGRAPAHQVGDGARSSVDRGIARTSVDIVGSVADTAV